MSAKATALALFSGGLDSILACRVLMEQGIRVIGLHFTTPFFEEKEEQRISYAACIQEKYGIETQTIDISASYLEMLRHPTHGFGKYFNPCIDCKILMFKQARQLLPLYGADFLISGEVLGQRPMSQRRDTLHLIERDAGCRGILLRPLSAQLLPPTQAELSGLVDRQRLHRFTGRSRKQQQALASSFNIKEYPAPAGGCMLADRNLSLRLRHFAARIFAQSRGPALADDFRLLLVGRQFQPEPGLWFVVGRNQQDNEQIAQLRGPQDWLLRLSQRPGPLGLLRHGLGEEPIAPSAVEDIEAKLAGIIVRYSKKTSAYNEGAQVSIERHGHIRYKFFPPLDEASVRQWMI